MILIVLVVVLYKLYSQSTITVKEEDSVEEKQEEFIVPDDISAEQRDKEIIRAYKQWKEKYIEKIEGNPDRYYVKYDDEGNTVSEAHGYGMLTMVMMAVHYDEKTKKFFDGMYYYSKDHLSDRNDSLMVWRQLRQPNGKMLDDKNGTQTGSATDGDMDIAYALLLADELWGKRW